MKQPDIGMKVAELRLAKQMTQEELAEHCEVSTRTIQRIESGEVDPRVHTLSMLTSALEFDFGADETESENLWLAVLHLSSMFLILVVPVVIWSWKKTQSRKIDEQGRQVLNFQITMTLILLSWVFLLVLLPAAGLIFGDAVWATMDDGIGAASLILFTTVVPIVVGIFCTYQGVVNAARAIGDKRVRYPLSIQFVK